MVEDIIYNLVHEIDVVKTKEMVDQYSKENERHSAMNLLKEQQRLLHELSLIEEAKRLAEAKDIESKVGEFDSELTAWFLTFFIMLH
jgi:hypothetical protein